MELTGIVGKVTSNQLKGVPTKKKPHDILKLHWNFAVDHVLIITRLQDIHITHVVPGLNFACKVGTLAIPILVLRMNTGTLPTTDISLCVYIYTHAE